VKARHDYLPFGEETGAGVGSRTAPMGYGAMDSTRQRFTSKERDTESGLDYFGARYYSGAQGRFISPDEFTGGPDELYYFANDAADNPTFYADLFEPQSLNKYQYCYNSPLRYVDPDGHQNPAGAATSAGLRQAAKAGAKVALKRAIGAAAGGVVGVVVVEVVDRTVGLDNIGAGAVAAFNEIVFESAKYDEFRMYGEALWDEHQRSKAATQHQAQAQDDASQQSGDQQSQQQGEQSSQLKPQKIDKKNQKPKKDRTAQGAIGRREDIQKAQEQNRKLGKPHKIESIERSKQDEKTALKKIKSLKDSQEDH